MNSKIVLYVVTGVLIVGILLLTFFPNMIHSFYDLGESEVDECLPPSGQTEESWREHMSHHPNIYKDCL